MGSRLGQAPPARWSLIRGARRVGHDAQQTGEPVAPGRPDNVFAPMLGDRGAHGRFDSEAHRRSLEVSARLRIRALGAAAAALLLGAYGAFALAAEAALSQAARSASRSAVAV